MVVGNTTHKNRGRNDHSLSGLDNAVGHAVADTIEALQPLLDHMFANADDFFFDMVEKSDLAEHQAMYFDALRRIRVTRATISDDFVTAISSSALEAWGEPNGPANSHERVVRRFNIDELSILSDDEADLAAAMSSIVSRGNVRYGHEISRLTSTLNSISRCGPLDDASNPLGVNSISRSFIDAIANLSLDVLVLLCFLKLFERDVTDALGDVYRYVIGQLKTAGVSIVEPAANKATLPISGLESNEDTGQTRGTAEFTELQSRLAASRDGGRRESFGGDQDPRSPARVEQLLDTLPAAQNEYLEQLSSSSATSGQSFPSLQTFLLSLPDAHGGFQNAGRTERDTLQLVSDLFEHMFRNETLSLASRALIARLQLPVLRVALLDKSLFSDAEHPARELLNRMAIDSIGWPTHAGLLERNTLYLAAEDIVRRLNDEFTDDISIFALMLDEWKEQVGRKRSRTEGAERRINESALGKAKFDAAKRIVQQLVNKRAAGSQLPRIVASFIADQWTKALVVTCTKFGTSSDQWHAACGTFDELLCACQPAGSVDETEARRIGVANLVSRIQATLELSGAVDSPMQETLDSITEALEEVVSEDELWFSGDSEYEVENLEVLEEITIPDTDHSEGLDATDQRWLSNLEPGSWVEFGSTGANDPVRCRLVVFVDQIQTYVFSNDDGIKVFEKSAAEMAQGLASDEIRIIREDQIVDRAIDELMADLRSSMQV